MRLLRTLLILTLMLLALSACSLAEDIPPPEGYNPPVAQELPASETNFPLMPPDPARGKAIYDVSCEPCHGETGLGNGSQASELPVQVPLLGNSEVVREVAPVEWFNKVTYGNIERFMPPFGGSLTDRQRWDVVAYAYTLSMQTDQLVMGEEVYANQCLDCHGESGLGDGVQAINQNLSVANWSDPARLARLSNQEIRDMVSTGLPGTGMPGFADSITGEQLWAVTKYVRSLSFAQTLQELATIQGQAGEAEVLEVPQTQPDLAAVKVDVVNGSGGDVPEGLLVTLNAFDNMQPADKLSGVLAEDGTYRFEDVTTPDQRVYLASVEYNDLTFYSDILRVDDLASGEEAQISVTIYESSTDTSQLVVERVHIFLEFPEPGTLQIAQLFLINNPTGQVIVPSQPGQAVIEFELPPDATALQFADSTLGERYIETANGFGDTANVAPGTAPHQVLFAYELPYERKQNLQIKMPLSVRAAVVALPDIEGLRLSSTQLRESGQRQVEGTSLHLYSANDLAQGSVLELTLTGRPGSGPLLSSGPVGNLILGGGMFLLVVLLGIFWIRQQRRGTQAVAGPVEANAEPESAEALLDAILALDDQYRSGELPVEAYKKRRGVLKERLRVAKMQRNEQEGEGNPPE
jgi:mono/diheme cytochrome c family protein